MLSPGAGVTALLFRCSCCWSWVDENFCQHLPDHGTGSCTDIQMTGGAYDMQFRMMKNISSCIHRYSVWRYHTTLEVHTGLYYTESGAENGRMYPSCQTSMNSGALHYILTTECRSHKHNPVSSIICQF